MDSWDKKSCYDTLQKVFQDLGQMSVFVPKVGLFKLQLLQNYKTHTASEVAQPVGVNFIQKDGAIEYAGIFYLSALFSNSRQPERRPILYFSFTLEFVSRFSSAEVFRHGHEEIIRIMKEHFTRLGDKSFSVYLEHCSRFDYNKAMLLSGSIPGWVRHRRALTKGALDVKGHLLYIMDRFLHYDSVLTIPAEDLAKARARVYQEGEIQTLIPRHWESVAMTTLSFVPIWNCDLGDQYVYLMDGRFGLEDLPGETKEYLEVMKREYRDRVITGVDVKRYFREGEAMLDTYDDI